MKKTLSILVAGATLAFAQLAGAQDFDARPNHTGEEFYGWCQDYPDGRDARLCAAYLDSAVFLLTSGSSSAGRDVTICVSDETPFPSVIATYLAYMEEHPELMQERAGSGITAALTDAYPCE